MSNLDSVNLVLSEQIEADRTDLVEENENFDLRSIPLSHRFFSLLIYLFLIPKFLLPKAEPYKKYLMLQLKKLISFLNLQMEIFWRNNLRSLIEAVLQLAFAAYNSIINFLLSHWFLRFPFQIVLFVCKTLKPFALLFSLYYPALFLTKAIQKSLALLIMIMKFFFRYIIPNFYKFVMFPLILILNWFWLEFLTPVNSYFEDCYHYSTLIMTKTLEQFGIPMFNSVNNELHHFRTVTINRIIHSFRTIKREISNELGLIYNSFVNNLNEFALFFGLKQN
ncbi:hypothetical protein M0812_25040 [Anaeramoeba flamelloides]|uniref:Uncharacterized protein n=1 Tax=Anaeramoeba flamelloides TaxID=1746091 RepID=A0AAV7YM05_9EUKA|nr:hypothetical protein M0812_25040 [Anaeramoeba flamelloides]